MPAAKELSNIVDGAGPLDTAGFPLTDSVAWAKLSILSKALVQRVWLSILNGVARKKERELCCGICLSKSLSAPALTYLTVTKMTNSIFNVSIDCSRHFAKSREASIYQGLRGFVIEKGTFDVR